MTPANHGGFLYALGLRRLLHPLTMIDIHTLLTRSTPNPPTTAGLLLGMSLTHTTPHDRSTNTPTTPSTATHGSSSPHVSKLLCLHVPPLLPPPFSTSIDIPGVVQASAVAGLGFLYWGTSQRLMSEFLVGEIGAGCVGGGGDGDGDGAGGGEE